MHWRRVFGRPVTAIDTFIPNMKVMDAKIRRLDINFYPPIRKTAGKCRGKIAWKCSPCDKSFISDIGEMFCPFDEAEWSFVITARNQHMAESQGIQGIHNKPVQNLESSISTGYDI